MEGNRSKSQNNLSSDQITGKTLSSDAKRSLSGQDRTNSGRIRSNRSNRETSADVLERLRTVGYNVARVRSKSPFTHLNERNIYCYEYNIV